MNVSAVLLPNEVLVAEFGTLVKYQYKKNKLPGFRISRANLKTGKVFDFLVNKSGLPASLSDGRGLERPVRVVFGPDGALYVVDWGILESFPPKRNAYPRTGVLWRVVRSQPRGG